MNPVGRGLTLAGAVLALAAVVAAAERARDEPTPLGRSLGFAADDIPLAAAADAMILRNAPPKPADVALARRVAVAEPLSPLPFYVLGAGAQVRDPRAALAAALRRDPRFRPAYRWQAVAAAKAGDIGAATRALIRLGVLSPTDQTIFPAVAQLAADPAARAAIKAELARGPVWRDSFLATLSASNVDRAVVFEMLESAGEPPAATDQPPAPGAPDDRRAFIAQMVARKDYERAYLAWVQWLPAASQGGVGHVFDGGFKGLAALPPFTWALTDGVGGATVIDPAAGLALDYSGTDGAVLAHQTILLPAGRYRLVTDARFDAAANENGAPPLVWSLSCAADAKVLAELSIPLDGTARRAGSAPFAVPEGCDAQLLALRVNSADFAKRIAGHIRSVAIETVK